MRLNIKKEIVNYDIIIIGGGFAGLTSAIYASRLDFKVLVLEKTNIGGKLNYNSNIEYYVGFEAINSFELIQNMRKQSENNNVKIEEFKDIVSLEFTETKKFIETENKLYCTSNIIIASGTKSMPLNIQDAEIFQGKGIHNCAFCDGLLYKRKRIAIIGNNNSALEEGLYLSRIAEEVIFIINKPEFNAENNIIEKIKSKKNITILYRWELKDLIGREHISGAIIKSINSNSEKVLPIDAIFYYMGNIPQTKIFKHYIILDENGYIITDNNMKTNVKNIYAVGDVRKKEHKQLNTALSDATIAVLNISRNI